MSKGKVLLRPSQPPRGVKPGLALINVLMLAAISVMAITAGTQYVSSTLRYGRQAQWGEQARQAAETGLQAAIAWLNQQENQPVLVFDPKFKPQDGRTTPEVAQADEPLGLASDFVIDAVKKLQGRYEVGRSADAPARGAAEGSVGVGVGPKAPTGAAPELYASGIGWVARDVSSARALSPGQVWRMRAKGYLWVKATDDQAWGSVPPLKSVTVEADVFRPKLSPPTAALTLYGSGSSNALQANTGDVGGVSLGVVDGLGTALRMRGTTLVVPNLEASGPNDQLGDTSLPAGFTEALQAHAGVESFRQLQAMADESLKQADLPAVLRGAKLFVASEGLSFDATHRLDAGGVLVCPKGLSLSGTGHRFAGLILLGEGLTMGSGSALQVEGAVVMRGPCRLAGSLSAPTAWQLSALKLDVARAALESYKLNISTLRVVDTEGQQP